MIRTHVYIWLIISTLAVLSVSCGRVPDYDKRLVEVDSIVATQPAQAKAVLLDINPNDLNDADEAYYNLLLTQACYINYDALTAGNDSIIQRALDYYSDHQADKEKFTRSNIYKGAVLEELGRVDSAMFYFKRAEVYADEKDDFNRGYAQLRMGDLYKRHQAYDGRDIEKFEDALKSFRKIQNNHYLILTLKDLGTLYRYRNAEKAEEDLNEAILLAKNEKDTTNYVHCVANLAYLYFMQSSKVGKDATALNKAYQELQQILRLNYLDKLTPFEYSTFASVYANKGKVDSASIFLDLAKLQYGSDPSFYESNNFKEPMSEIAKANGNMLKYYKLSHECDSVSFSLYRDLGVLNVMNAEIDWEKQFKEKQDADRRIRYYFMAGMMLLLLLLALLFYRRAHRYDKLVLELKDQSRNQMQDLSGLQGSINELKINDERLKSFISSHMGMMREMIDACYHEPNNRIAENMKRIVKFQDSNRDNWVKLYDYIDMEHNNIMTRTREQYPQLNDKDLLLLALTCMGYSYIQTAIIMGYSNATSVSVIKQRLAKKMGLDCSLNEYIERNEKQENPNEKE